MSRIFAILFALLFGLSQWQIRAQQNAIEGLQIQLREQAKQIDLIAKVQAKVLLDELAEKKDLSHIKVEGDIPTWLEGA
jgi:hypothetical protein